MATTGRSRRVALAKSSLPGCAAALWPIRGPARGLAEPPASVVWTFDRLDRIGGHRTTVEGNPKVIGTPAGKAVQFDGVDDVPFISHHPLAGAETFTFEAIFRPDGGDFEQRWSHLDSHILFELRVVGSQWHLDAFVNGPGYSRVLMFQDKLHPLGRWYHVAQVYDGTEYRSYVNGELQGRAEMRFRPQGPGSAAVGVRLNRVNYFKGAVRQAQFTPRALPPAEFMSVPAQR